MVDILEKYLNKRLSLVNESIANNVKTLYTIATLLNANIAERNAIHVEKKLEVRKDKLLNVIDMICDYYVDDYTNDYTGNYKKLEETIDIDLDTATIESDENLDSITDNFMQQQSELDDLIAEKRKISNEITYIPKRDIKFHLETKVVPDNARADDARADDDNARADNINSTKVLPPMNALTRISHDERDELLYKMYLRAKDNITKKNQNAENLEQLINDEADRLLKLYLETH